MNKKNTFIIVLAFSILALTLTISLAGQYQQNRGYAATFPTQPVLPT